MLSEMRDGSSAWVTDTLNVYMSNGNYELYSDCKNIGAIRHSESLGWCITSDTITSDGFDTPDRALSALLEWYGE